MSARIHRKKAGSRILTATDGGTARLEQVDVVLVLQCVDLLRGQTGVGEHAVLKTGLVRVGVTRFVMVALPVR